jgi:adenine-specific DNA-methyltransferase
LAEVKRRKDQTSESKLQDAVATAEVLFSLGQSEAQAIAINLDTKARTDFARGLCASVLASFWTRRVQGRACPWELRKPVVAPLKHFSGLADRIGGALAQLPPPRAGFLAGQLYTALLPEDLRKDLAAFYTPPSLVERLLDLVTQSGFEWSRGRVIDPACGGAAFLASAAPRLVRASRHKSPSAVLEDIESRLVGIEIDPFAAWVSMVLLDLSLLETALAAQRPLKALVMPRDALEVALSDLGQFDLVIGNPPYGKVTVSPGQRHRFRESLFGHANLYGLFTELGVRLARPGGFIAYVTPPSFLGGEYFKNLRKLLSTHAPLLRLELIQNREGVFNGVLQETILAVFNRQSPPRAGTVQVSLLRSEGASGPLVNEAVGKVTLTSADGSPWLLPRSREQLPLLRQLALMPDRLAGYGFSVSTGQLVWNRHKNQLRAGYEPGCRPIIWAEAVSSDGRFQFQAARRTHLPYLRINHGQDWLLNQEPCILVQRTTAKEQKRRLIAAVVPNSFVLEYPGFVVENHLNMVYSLSARPRIALRTLAALLNSRALDQAFRCMNGSVAVSAYELNSLPLPNPEQMRKLQEMVLSGASSAETEETIAAFYNIIHEPGNATSASYSRQSHRQVLA